MRNTYENATSKQLEDVIEEAETRKYLAEQERNRRDITTTIEDVVQLLEESLEDLAGLASYAGDDLTGHSYYMFLGSTVGGLRSCADSVSKLVSERKAQKAAGVDGPPSLNTGLSQA